MAGSQETGTSLMDLITADPAPPGNPAFPPLGVNPTPDRTKPTPPRKSTSQPPTTDLLVSIKAPTPTKSSLAPLKQKRKPVSYSQLARALQELASATDQVSKPQKENFWTLLLPLGVWSLLMLCHFFLCTYSANWRTSRDGIPYVKNIGWAKLCIIFSAEVKPQAAAPSLPETCCV
jgi:hypothetical protein